MWLSPNNSYPGSEKYAKVRGEAAGDMEVWAVPLSQEQSVRFLKDYNAQKDGTIFPVYYVGGAYMEGRRAVSYTHLDVYKRQGRRRNRRGDYGRMRFESGGQDETVRESCVRK